jgi:Leucine-rich repeat (LRR) protein
MIQPLFSVRGSWVLVLAVLASLSAGCRPEEVASSSVPQGPAIGMTAEDPSLDPLLRRLFAGPDDYDLVEGVYQRLVQKVDNVSYSGRRNTSSLTTEQRVVYDVWYVYSLLSNDDTFKDLLAADGEVLPTLPDSLEAIGASEEARITREAQTVVPPGTLPTGVDEADVEERTAAVENLSQEQTERLEELSKAFESNGRRLVRKVADYVRIHKEQFAHLPESDYEDISDVENDNLPVPAADAAEAEVFAWINSMDGWITRRGPYLAERTVKVTVPRAGNVVMHVTMPVFRRTTDEELAAMAGMKALQEVRGLTFTQSWLTRDGLKHLKNFRHLQVLDLTGTDLTDEWLDELTQLKGLRDLDLSETAITDEGVKRLAGLTELRRLALNDVQITDEGVAALAALTQLEELELSSTEFGGAGLKALASLPLRELNLDESNVTDEGLAAVGELQHLKTLHLTECQLGPDALAGIGRCKNLETLYANKSSISDEGLGELAGLAQLKNLHLSETRLRGEGFAALAGLKNLRSLTMYRADVNDEGVAEIARLPALATLYLADTKVSDHSLAALATMTSLEHLSLSGTQVTASAKLQQLAALKSLESLSLPAAVEDDPEVEKLKKALPNCSIYCF